MGRSSSSAALVAILGLAAVSGAVASTTGLQFVGGCPEAIEVEPCGHDGNPTVENVSAILGADVVSKASGFAYTIDSGSGDLNGTWSVTDPSITHLAFKADGYFILGEIVPSYTLGSSEHWSTDIHEWGVITTVFCPAAICGDSGRYYTLADFTNGGTNPAGISHVDAFSVVPLPAAAWLFGTALLGLFGLQRVLGSERLRFA